MIRVITFVGVKNDLNYSFEHYLNEHNIAREQIISISYVVDIDDVHERILLVYEEK